MEYPEIFGISLTTIYIITLSVLKSAVLFLIHYQYCPVCQGSIHSPLLFLIYINDLSLVTQFSDLFLFANDAKLCKIILHP